MKKFMLFTLAVIIALTCTATGLRPDRADETVEYYIPSNPYIASCPDYSVVRAGTFDIVRVKADKCEEIESRLGKVLGKAIRYRGDMDDVREALKKYAVSVREEGEIEGVYTVYGYSRKLDGGVKINGENVNIQIAFGNNQITIGTPLIMGSY